MTNKVHLISKLPITPRQTLARVNDIDPELFEHVIVIGRLKKDGDTYLAYSACDRRDLSDAAMTLTAIVTSDINDILRGTK